MNGSDLPIEVSVQVISVVTTDKTGAVAKITGLLSAHKNAVVRRVD